MYTLSIIMKVLLALLVVTAVARTVYAERHNMKFITTIWSRFRVLMFFEVFIVILQTGLIYGLLVWCSPLFKYGWINLIFGKSGNMYIAPITEAASASISWVRVLPFLFFPLLLAAVPFMAHIEENMFRKGNHEWPDIIKQSVVFGLVHCLAGVPLAAGIALIGGGFFYACKYRKAFLKGLDKHGDYERAEEEAVLVSTTYHALYNSVLIILTAMLAITALN